jgi:protein phosphatase
VLEDEIGMCYTQTGRRFFSDLGLEKKFLDRVRIAVEKAGLWDELSTDWLCLDCELMPWSAKAQDLLRQQYAPTGAAAKAGLTQAISALQSTAIRLPEAASLVASYEQRAEAAEAYVEAYRRYCWPVNSLLDLKLAPFHLLASEGAVYGDKDHTWHMTILGKLAEQDEEMLVATPHRVVNLNAAEEVSKAIQWWEELTESGGEGMVVKPLSFIAKNRRGLIQPAVKCRGKEYLRIIYGPEYTAPHNLERLRSRGLSAKRSLALREFALGMEGLHRFVESEPLRRVHECAFAVLALESEPVDPRL